MIYTVIGDILEIEHNGRVIRVEREIDKTPEEQAKEVVKAP